MRRLPVALAALAVMAASAAPADAALRFGACGTADEPSFDPVAVRCAKLAVPLDRSGAQPGTVTLHVERVRARRATGAVFAFSGGPGQAAAPSTQDFATVLAPALARRDLVVFDQRGTGRSGALRCPELERAGILDATAEAAQCAELLGPARARYTTRDSVEDIEAVRAELGVTRITLFGISYGTKVALAYARAYPARVERLVLDSVVAVDGPDPLYRETLTASRRVLAQLCGRGACRGVTPDPVADVRALLARLDAGAVTGTVVGRDGRRRPATLTRAGLFTAMDAGDFDPVLRLRLPGAVRAALRGDPAAVLRLVARAEAQEGVVSPRDFSAALYAATTCEESALPWPRTAPFDSRRGHAEQAVAALPDDLFTVFDRRTVLESDVLRLCERWPASAAPPALATGPPPDVPVLLFAGADDTRTPVETASRVAAEFPRATLVRVRASGHSVLGTDLSGCADDALARFFRNRAPRPCRARGPLEGPVVPVPPRSLDSVRRAPGVPGRAGRTLAAVELALEDIGVDLLSVLFSGALSGDDDLRLGGLRGGYLEVGERGVRIRRYEHVPGVWIDGTTTADGSFALRVGGRRAARGRLRLDAQGRLTGRLGGRRVRTRAPGLDADGPRAARLRLVAVRPRG